MYGSKSLRAVLAGGVCAMAITAATAANAESRDFNVPAGDLQAALDSYAQQAGVQLLYKVDLVKGVPSKGARGVLSSEDALAMLLSGTGLQVRHHSSGAVAIVAGDASDPQSGSAAGDGADQGTVAALVVTAQKREENIQDVPIAMSAFTQEDLTRSQVAGGPDLMTQVPNFTFTKTNFSGYSIQIRGIGTQAVSATVDPAVAVAFNNTPFTRNRFFEQEFYDLERVEVLRGPQGTLYGRNATAGVVNILSAKPVFHYEARLAGDVANYSSSRLEGMVNIPLVEDKVALRLAGAWTKRQGYVTNAISGDQTDGRDLWSTRLSLRVDPTSSISAKLIYEHFEESDDRLRSGKQLCDRDPGPTEAGGVALDPELTNRLSQGCLPASLYAAESFQVPNGYALPYYYPLSIGGLPAGLGGDPYASTTQSRDLRVIESSVEPRYNAKNDTVEFQIQLELPHHLSLSSETGYSSDRIFSFQDFNRFNTAPGAFDPTIGNGPDMLLSGRLDQNGVFCDPQLGCSDRLVGADLSTGSARQFNQEFRLSSDFGGKFDFNLGANFMRSDSVDKYYVFFNSLTLFATTNLYKPFQDHYYVAGQYDNDWCMLSMMTSDPRIDRNSDLPFGCIYIDPNPIGSLNDRGRNYFLSKNPYKLLSYAAFGEATYQVSPTLKLTGGLRWTVDKKRAPIVPSWLLVIQSYGLPVARTVEQEWKKPTGRVVLDWTPALSFTDQTMVYASYSHGYKAGGANPPLPANAWGSSVLNAMEAAHPLTFGPEFVNAYEIGTKNTLLDGRLTLNATSFYYDYTGYQISQIADRSAINLNFDAKIWGAELEADWRPFENLRLGMKVGFEKTRLADGSRALDMMDRTAGREGWMVVKPFPIYPSNCVLPDYVIQNINWQDVALNSRGVCAAAYYDHHDPVTQADYQPYPYGPGGYPGFNPDDAPNAGAGFFKDLSGNELPNAPHVTGTLTVDYTLPLPNNWLMTLHSDFYYQSEAWTRVFNTPGYDKLKAYTNLNLAAIFTNESAGWHVMAYVKNAFDRDSITGAFLNSDDTGLTTNVFLTEPRLYGLRVTKNWTGDSVFGSGARDPNRPFPFRIELGGGVDRFGTPKEAFAPGFVGDLTPAISPVWAQNRRLDWGDSRDLKLIYTPDGGALRLSLAMRYGKANASPYAEASEIGAEGCRVGYPYESLCDTPGPKYHAQPKNYGISSVYNHEDFTVADFAVGKDVGLGMAGDRNRTSVEGGLRYAHFSSTTKATIRADNDWYVAPTWANAKYAQHTLSTASFAADRSFSGAGPFISGESSFALIDEPGVGRVAIDAGLTGGVLFGKQKAANTHKMRTDVYDGIYYLLARKDVPPITTDAPPPVENRRGGNATVPMLGLSLGVSYETGRIRMSGGYRIDRFYNAVDGGVDAHKNYDRTIEGPYFKVSVGFGG